MASSKTKEKASFQNLDLSRGKPSKEQLDLCNELFGAIKPEANLNINSFDYRNYGLLEGIPECKHIFSQILEVPLENLIIGGNSSLALMYNMISKSVTHGVCGSKPWKDLKKIKWLCPVPGYDRHFAICEFFGIKMVNIPINEEGPDMDLIESYIKDEAVKGIWCVPKYSNPTGITFSDNVVKRFAKLRPAAKDFRIYWDNAYAVHDLYESKKERLLNIFSECQKNGNEDLVYIFTSTSKITFPGSGVSAIALSQKNKVDVLKQMSIQTIGYDKINQYRHSIFLKKLDEIMKRHADLLRPKFQLVDKIFSEELTGVATWTKPLGGYFITLNTGGHAKEIVEKCKERGVLLTEPGSTFPYKKDPSNSIIRIAPSYLSLEELGSAIRVLCSCVKCVKFEILKK